MSRRPSDSPPRDPSILAYAMAHFGKSLWWNGSELFLAFYLTEHLRLAGLDAGIAIATGLAIGAGFDLLVARWSHWCAGAARAGRAQLVGAAASLLALVVLAAVPAGGDARFTVVVAANILYRLAYVFYDLPQNCLLSLLPWSPERRRTAVAARTAASAAALLLMSALVGLAASGVGTRGIGLAGAVVAGAAVALATAAWLWHDTRRRPDPAVATPVPISSPAPIGRSIVLIAIACLTVPAFSKLAPYVASYSHGGAAVPLLLIVGAATAVSQPLWLMALRRWDEAATSMVAGVLLAASAPVALAALPLSAVMVGMASGGLGTVIWAGFAQAVAQRSPAQAAPAYARLTAVAKVALAVAALLIGALLDATDYRSDGAGLLPFMAALVMAGGCAVVLHAAAGARIARGIRPRAA